jgi:hypothetical protein
MANDYNTAADRLQSLVRLLKPCRVHASGEHHRVEESELVYLLQLSLETHERSIWQFIALVTINVIDLSVVNVGSLTFQK